MKHALVVALATAQLACQAKSMAPAAEPAAEPTALSDDELLVFVDRVLAMQDKMASAASAAHGDCATLARAFDKIIDANLDLLDPQLRARIDAAGKDRFDTLVNARRGDRFTAIATRLQQGVAPCGRDRELERVMQRLAVEAPR